MADFPKTGTNSRPYQAFVVVATFTLVMVPNVGLHLLQPAGAIGGTNVITLPWNAKDGDEYYIVSEYGITGITVGVASGSGQSILAGPAAVTALTAGVQVGYIKQGNSWLRIQ